MSEITTLLAAMLAREASDLHLSAGSAPTLRVHGVLEPMAGEPLGDAEIRSLVWPLVPESARPALDAGRSQSFGYTMEEGRGGRFRLNVYPQRRGLSCAIRALPMDPPSLEDLSLPRIVPNFVRGLHGLVIIAGTTGSGKSTTMAACVRELNHSRPLHILTLERPIEYVHTNVQSMIHQREIGTHAPSFDDALLEALRQDPDVIVVGEVRDPATIRRALLAAETGHLVFTTLHAGSAPKAVGRLVSVFPPDEQPMIRTILADTLRVIVAQKLVRTASRDGRMAVTELLVGTGAVATQIRESRTHQLYSTMQAGKQAGMRTLTDAMASLLQQQKIDPDDAREKAPDPADLEAALRAHRL